MLVQTVGPSFVSSQSPRTSVKATGARQTETDARRANMRSIKESFEDDESDQASQEGVRDVTASNSFLMRIVHGRVPNALLQSQISEDDRQNLSNLVPRLNQNNLASQNLTYQDIYAEVREAVMTSFKAEDTRFSNEQ